MFKAITKRIFSGLEKKKKLFYVTGNGSKHGGMWFQSFFSAQVNGENGVNHILDVSPNIQKTKVDLGLFCLYIAMKTENHEEEVRPQGQWVHLQ